MCGHSFTYHSVIPPTHCPICGACLGCGRVRVPAIYPPPYRPYTPWPVPQRPWGPYYTVTSPNTIT